MWSVDLAPGEIAVGTLLGTTRHTVNESVGVREQKFSKDGLAIHIRGALTEIAFAKGANLFPDLTTTPRSHTYDFRIGDYRIDVKGVEHDNDRLLTHLGKRIEDADIYVVGVVKPNRVVFKGWATAEELINPLSIKDIGYGDTYIINDRDLHQDRWPWQR